MAGELALVAPSSGLVVDSDIYKDGSFFSTVRLAASAGGPSSTLYKADFPRGAGPGKYLITYRVQGNSDIQGPDVIWWNGSAEVSLVALEAKIAAMAGTGFSGPTDSLEALSNAIAQGAGTTGNSGSTAGAFGTLDRATLARIESAAKEAAAGAVGDFYVDKIQKIATLQFKDGGEAAAFRMKDIDGQPSILNAVQRTRI